jgi:hypothetical protein
MIKVFILKKLINFKDLIKKFKHSLINKNKITII